LITAGSTLQVTHTLNPASWGAAGGGSVVNGYNQLTVNTGSTPGFYRLVK
jgi:hypothetical protein